MSPLEELRSHLRFCSTFLDLDVEETWSLAVKMSRYYRGDQTVRAEMRRFHELESRWYKSLDDGDPDYDVYRDRSVLSDMCACWLVYSRDYVNSINRLRASIPGLADVASIVDVGNGASLSTIQLRSVFPEAFLCCTNVVESDQYTISERTGEQHRFSVHPNTRSVGRQVDLVFASEYFEHFEDPISHLERIVSDVEPRFLVIANAFGTTALGHFCKHRKGPGPLYPAVGYGQRFDRRLRELGFEKVETDCWNDRPAFWRRATHARTPGALF